MLKDIGARAGVNIVWGEDIGEEKISGRYVGAPVNEMLQSIADSYNFNFYQSGSIFCFSKSDNEIKYYGLVKSTLDKERLTISDVDVVHMGNTKIIAGKRRDVMNAIVTINQLQQEITRGYNCELQIVKMSKELYLKLQAKISSLGYNLASGIPSLDKVLKIDADWDLKDTDIKIVQRPILYVSDGNKATFRVGTTRTLERRASSEYGYMSTAGYDEKSDGFELELVASYLSDGLASVGVKIKQSSYRDELTSDKEALPINDNNEIDNPCLFAKNDVWYLVASLNDEKKENVKNFIGFSRNNRDYLFLVFLRIHSISFDSSNFSY